MDGEQYVYTNTIDNFEECYNSGFRYFEVDFLLSTDGKLIGAHDYRYLTGYENGIDYETYCNLKILGCLTGITIENLANFLETRRDAYIVLDLKFGDSETDVINLVDELIDELNDLNKSELVANFIPQLYTFDMWETMKDDYPFEKYIYTNYISSHSMLEIISCFYGEDKIIAITLWDFYSKYDISLLRMMGFEVYLYTINDVADIEKAINKGATGIYTDNTQIYNY